MRLVGLAIAIMVPIVASATAGCDGRTGTAAANTPPTSAPAAAPILEANAWLTVQPRDLRCYRQAIGTLRAPQSARVAAQVTGRVDAVLVDVGDRVTKGQVLVRLDRSFFQIAMQQQQAALDAARGALAGVETNVTYWARELTRQEGLLERRAGSTKETDDTRTALDRAVAARDEQRAKVAEVEQKLAYAAEQLAQTEVRAPYDGVITQRMIDTGDMAASMPITELLEVRQVDSLFLEFSLPQEYIDAVHEGTPLEYSVEGVAGPPTPSKIAVVFPALDEATRTVRCRAIVPNPDGRLQPGILLRVRVLEREASNALVVPRQSLVQTADGWLLFVAADGRPEARAVRTGMLTDEEAEIVSGLAVGERVLKSADLHR